MCLLGPIVRWNVKQGKLWTGACFKVNMVAYSGGTASVTSIASRSHNNVKTICQLNCSGLICGTDKTQSGCKSRCSCRHVQVGFVSSRLSHSHRNENDVNSSDSRASYSCSSVLMKSAFLCHFAGCECHTYSSGDLC